MNIKILNQLSSSVDSLLNNNNYHGKIELYFLRYGVKTIPGVDGEKRKVDNAVIYEAEIKPDVQKDLLDIFKKNLELYKNKQSNIVSFDVIGKEKENLAKLKTADFENVNTLISKIKTKDGVIASLKEMNLDAITCFICKINVSEDNNVFYFGKLSKFTKLHKGKHLANITNSQVTKLKIDKFFGFANFVSFFEYKTDILIENQDHFDSVFKMKTYYNDKALLILDEIKKYKKVSKEDIAAIKSRCERDSRVAKRFMKLNNKFDKISIFFSNLNHESLGMVVADKEFKDKFNKLKFINGQLCSVDEKDDTYYTQLMNLIRDTPSKGIISGLSRMDNGI